MAMASSKGGSLPFDPCPNQLALNPCTSGLLPCMLGISGVRRLAQCNQSRQLWHIPRTHLFNCGLLLLPWFWQNNSWKSNADASKPLINQATVNTPLPPTPDYQVPHATGRSLARGVSPCLPNQQTIYWWHGVFPSMGMVGQPICHDCLPYRWEPNFTTGFPEECRQTLHSCLHRHHGAVGCMQAFGWSQYQRQWGQCRLQASHHRAVEDQVSTCAARHAPEKQRRADDTALQKPLPLHSCRCQCRIFTVPVGSSLTTGQSNYWFTETSHNLSKDICLRILQWSSWLK